MAHWLNVFNYLLRFLEPTTVPSKSCTDICDESQVSPNLEVISSKPESQKAGTSKTKTVKKKSSQTSIKSKNSSLTIKSKKSTKSVQKIKSMASRKSLTPQRKISLKKSIGSKTSQKSVGQKSSRELKVKSLDSKGFYAYPIVSYKSLLFLWFTIITSNSYNLLYFTQNG